MVKTIDEYEVIVVGGGAGGFAAATAAGRGGARTLVLEREGCLGGGATTMLVHPFMPHLTTEGPDGQAPKIVNAGIFKEVTDRLVARGAGRAGRCVSFDDEVMKLVMDELVAEAGAEVIFHAALFDVTVADGRVAAARFAHNGGPIEVAGKVFIDATGDSLLAASAGCACEFGDESGTVMPMTLNFRVGGVDTDNLPGWQELKDIAREGDKDDPPLINTNLSTFGSRQKGYVHFNAIRVPGSTIDPGELSFAETESRRRVDNFVRWLRARVPAFRNCYLVKSGDHVGIRESRRVMGDYVLTGEEVRTAAKFDDGIACCSYVIDIHGQAQGQTRIEHLPPGEHYQIPYRCLTPKGTENLLMASRGISADVVAHSSLRIMPCVMNVGTAAGFAAAMSLPSGRVRDVDVQQLRRRIRRDGGVLEPE